MKTIGILTSSRADYGIYLPLLNILRGYSDFNLKLIVFGTHLSPFHGFSINQIQKDGFKVDYSIESILVGDTSNAISTAMALTSLKFADFWKERKNEFDVVFCLGDRYEMFAAVIAGIPYNIKFAHLHGGEKTLGSIDNIFRHAITLSSKYHFVSCEDYRNRVAEIIETSDNIYNVGALSLDNLSSLTLLTIDEFKSRYNIDLEYPTILVTFHPETINPEINKLNVEKLADALLNLTNYQVLITLPNADQESYTIRKKLLQLPSLSNNRILCFENLGSQAYFTIMKYCSFLLGNTSSGIIEAASFGKWVINLGSRQSGRKQSKNVFNVQFDENLIVETVSIIENTSAFSGENIYYKGNAAENICSILRNLK